MTHTIMQCYTKAITQIEALHLRCVSIEEIRLLYQWLVCVCDNHFTMCVNAGDIKGWRFASLHIPSARFRPVLASEARPLHGGLCLGSRLYGCLNKSLTHSIRQVAGDETTRLTPGALFQCACPMVSHYNLHSG